MVNLIPLIALALASGLVAPSPSQPQAAEPATAMRQRVRQLLTAGRLDAALLAAQQSLAEHTSDASVRREFVSLHLSLARAQLRVEDFAGADLALKAVLKIEPAHADAMRLTGSITRARSAAPGHAKRASRWLEVEWYEPAFRAIGQAIALVPGRRDEWAADHRAAAIGAGDDHYLTKNFHEAFYCYDAAVRLINETGRRPPASLLSRWLQSMCHGLARDIDRVGYPPEYWRLIAARIRESGADTKVDRRLSEMVSGLAREDLGDLAAAAEHYGRVLGQPVVGAGAASIRDARDRSLRRLRQLYDKSLCDRRKGSWSQSARGPLQVHEGRRFRIHHRNAEAARRVDQALRFHFDRIPALLDIAPETLKWPDRCDLFLYRSVESMQEATEQSGDVQAISVIRRRGDRVESFEIHVALTDRLLLSTSLAHELAHLIVAAATDSRPIPGAVAEGLALYVEPRCRLLQFARVFARQAEPRGLRALLAVSQTHPSDPGFYAQSLRLVQTLLERGGVEPLLSSDGDRWDAGRLARRFDFDSAADLDRAYRGRPKSPSGKRPPGATAGPQRR